MNKTVKLTTTICMVLLLGVAKAQGTFKVNIDRKMSTKNCTMGYMSVNDEPMFYTLELPWKDNKKEISSIPEGTYKAILRYDHKEKWRIQLLGVPNRDLVQIHVGNYTSDIRGCVLIGDDADINNCIVTGSRTAYKKFKKTFYGTETPTSTPNKEITVIFKNEY